MNEGNKLSPVSQTGVLLIMLICAIWRSQCDLQDDTYLSGGDRTDELLRREKACLKLFEKNDTQTLKYTLRGIRDSFAQWRSSKTVNLLSAFYGEKDSTQIDSYYMFNYLMSPTFDRLCGEDDLDRVEEAVLDQYIGNNLLNSVNKKNTSQFSGFKDTIINRTKQVVFKKETDWLYYFSKVEGQY